MWIVVARRIAGREIRKIIRAKGRMLDSTG